MPPRSGTSGLSVLVAVALLIAACGKRSSAPPASWEPDRSCVSSDECRPVEGCCPSPCTSDVINVRDMEKMQRRLEEQCKNTKREDCPQAGACVEHRYLCVRGRCALVLAGSPDWPEDAGTSPP